MNERTYNGESYSYECCLCKRKVQRGGGDDDDEGDHGGG